MKYLFTIITFSFGIFLSLQTLCYLIISSIGPDKKQYIAVIFAYWNNGILIGNYSTCIGIYIYLSIYLSIYKSIFLPMAVCVGKLLSKLLASFE